jgi:hypothetical protein
MITGPLTPSNGEAAGGLVVEDPGECGRFRTAAAGRPACPDATAELGPPQVEDEGREASKNLITTFPATASVHHDVGVVGDEVLPFDVPDEVEIGRVEQLGRALDAKVALALLSPMESSAIRGFGMPTTRSAKIAPIRAYWARFSGDESGFAPMSRSTNGRPARIIWTARAGRSTPGGPPDPQHRAGHRGAGVARRHHGIGLAIAGRGRRRP